MHLVLQRTNNEPLLGTSGPDPRLTGESGVDLGGDVLRRGEENQTIGLMPQRRKEFEPAFRLETLTTLVLVASP